MSESLQSLTHPSCASLRDIAHFRSTSRLCAIGIMSSHPASTPAATPPSCPAPLHLSGDVGAADKYYVVTVGRQIGIFDVQ
jgi:hypothetical protein